MKQSQFVSLKIYDVLGNEVATLVNEEKPAGNYEVEFNSHSGNVENLPAGREGLTSGVYLYQLRVGNFIDTKEDAFTKVIYPHFFKCIRKQVIT